MESLNINSLKDYSKSPGPSKYVDEQMRKNLPNVLGHNGKSIDPTDFDRDLCPNIRLAIENSKNSKFSTDLIKLCSNPGTRMGLLMDEILPKK